MLLCPVTFALKGLDLDAVGLGGLGEDAGPARDELDVIEDALALVAHVLSACIHARLPVPALLSTLDQSRVDQTATALRVQDILTDLLEVPAVVSFFDEPGEQLDRVHGLGQGGRNAAGARAARWSQSREGVRVLLGGAQRDGRCAGRVAGSGQVGLQR